MLHVVGGGSSGQQLGPGACSQASLLAHKHMQVRRLPTCEASREAAQHQGWYRAARPLKGTQTETMK